MAPIGRNRMLRPSKLPLSVTPYHWMIAAAPFGSSAKAWRISSGVHVENQPSSLCP